MIGGFALLAFPAQYGVSGVMTFVVNHEGVVYQKDLGRATARAEAEVSAFDPERRGRASRRPRPRRVEEATRSW